MKIGSTQAMSASPPTNPPDEDEWDDEAIECRECHTLLRLTVDCEWPNDPRLILCWNCMSWAYESALKAIDKLTAEQDTKEQDA